MVSTKTNKRKTVSKDNSTLITILAWFLVIILVELLILIIISINRLIIIERGLTGLGIGFNSEDYSNIVPKNDLPDKIDFQPIINNWVNKTQGDKAVLVYDFDRDEIAGEYNAGSSYSIASLYKLFVVYEGYLKVQSGEWLADSPCGYTGHTILECLDLSIRTSDSSCAETLWGMIGRDKLNTILKEKYGFSNFNLSSISATSYDVLSMLKKYYDHKDLKDENLISKMKDSFLNQPQTVYDWRQGLPKGFSKANVYNKVGWDYDPEEEVWNLYHDAAIIEFPEDNRHFAVIVLTKKISPYLIRQFGSELEHYYYNH